MDTEWIVPGYRHVQALGEGASGRVVHAEHIETGTPVAIKYLSDRLRRDEEFLSRFRDEARLLADLDDPNVVRFHEYVESPTAAAIVMELVNGVTLAAMIEREGPTEPEAALVVLKGSLLGLAAAHAAGVVHRDYKPGNVLVRGDGMSKLTDFGIAVRGGTDAPAAGTPAYMPPEQWGGRPVGPATDVYAATAVFYECLTGERPYQGRTIQQLAVAHRSADIPVERVPEQLRGVVEHGLAKDPIDRPHSARDFLGELEAVAFAAYGVGWEERGRNQLKERAALLALLFPLGRAPEAGASSVALTELGGGKSAGARNKIALAAGAGVLGVLLLGGGTAAVIASSGSSTPLAKNTPTASADPSAGPSTEPSTDPSADPSTSASPADSPSPSPSPTTSAPTTAPPGGGNGSGNNGNGGAAPTVKPTTKKPIVVPPKPKPTPFHVTHLDIAVDPPNSDGNGTFTVTIQTAGKPAKPVTLTISSSTKVVDSSTGTIAPGTITYKGNYSRGVQCRQVTITVSASPGPASNSGTSGTDPNCQIIN